MGKGKGDPEDWVAVVESRARPVRARGRRQETLAREAFHLADHKLSVKTRFVAREQML